jgi:hypothetical protein
VGRHLLWVALAACPSILLLAVTNHLTQDVAAIPFLWILPLTLYLVTFILCFDAEGWYQREVFLLLLVPALAGMAYLLTSTEGVSVKITLTAFAAAFFVCCMVCHGELARLKPDPRHLTAFYLMISIGGAMGGLFVGIVAPYLFVSYFEFPIAVALVAVLVFIVLTLDKEARFHTAWLSPQFILALSVVLSLSIYLARAARQDVHNYKVVQRNFYGTLRVRAVGNMDDWDGYRTLLHGNINHGEQWTHPDRRRDAITYYCKSSGVGRAMRARMEGKPNRVGILGLGAGTLVTFGRPGDYYRVYEINPLVPALARKEFTFLPDSRAKVDVVLGDARLSMEREPPQNFDMLIMDAFSGDSVPVHLITREAFALYFRHLKPDGVLAVHISNKYLNLEPVIQRAVEKFQKAALLIEDEEDDEGTCFGTTWVLVTANPEYFKQAAFQGVGHPLEPKPGVPIWTDDYSNMFRILR